MSFIIYLTRQASLVLLSAKIQLSLGFMSINIEQKITLSQMCRSPNQVNEIDYGKLSPGYHLLIWTVSWEKMMCGLYNFS